jgi:hypothetical protein
MNAAFDGTNWNSDDTSLPVVVFDVSTSNPGMRLRYAAAGVNPKTLSTAMQMSTAGVMQIPKISPIADSTTAMQWFKADGSTAIMTIDSTNSTIGIGRLPVSTKILAVSAANQTPYLAAFYNATYSTTTPAFEYYAFNTGVFGMGTPADKAFYLYTNGNNNARLYILGTGEIGMGVGEQGTVGVPVSIRGGTASGLNVTLKVKGGAQAAGSGPSIDFNQSWGNTLGNWITGRIGSTYQSGSYGGNLVFYTNTGTTETSYTEKMRIDKDGKLKITGTIFPYADSTTAFQFFKADGTTAVATIDTTNTRLGIGVTPLSKLHISDGGSALGGGMASGVVAGAVVVQAQGSNFPEYQLFDSSDTPTQRGILYFGKSRGTNAVPTVVVNGDNVGDLLFAGYDGSALQNAAGLFAYVDGVPAAGSVPMRLSFVTGTNSSTRKERLKIDSVGLISIGQGGGTATNSGYLKINNDGYAAPSAVNVASEGDKLVMWNSATVKTAIGLASSELWLQSYGATGKITFHTGTSVTGAERMRLDENGRLGVGTSPEEMLHVKGIDQRATFLIENTYTSGASSGAGLVMRNNDGAALASGDRLGYMLWAGYDGAANRNSVGFTAWAESAWSSGTFPSYLAVEATTSGTREEVLRFNGAGMIMADAKNITLNATTGTKIGTATNQKLGFYNATPIVQGASVADAIGGAIVDAEARAAINALISRIEALGLIATV